ncbi:hypothetical protein [Mycobacterium sp. 155]|uniref:hypothetical protein n=1 Tax=Mycobacterium sp. 155 TaxID=1157943 RepID=UPI0003A2AEC2|nr:hypothetical protein [Mycobacterium sp. 155]
MRGLINLGGAAAFPPSSEHITRLKDVVRAVAQLEAAAPVLVQQLACAEPGCPPVETVVAVLGPPRRTWKFPKPTIDISAAELRAELLNHPHGDDHD